MKHALIVSTALISLTMSLAAYADDKMTSETQTKTTVAKDANGNYHKKQTKSSTQTDESGTTTKAETKVEVDTEADGEGEKKVTTEVSTDPKGLMNKTKTTTVDSAKYKDGKIEKKYQKKVDGKTVEENTEEATTVTK